VAMDSQEEEGTHAPHQRRAGPVDPCTVIILGATGDLTSRKLIPALAGLGRDGLLPEQFCLVGAGRTGLSTEEFVKRCTEGIQKYTEGGAVPEDVTKRLMAATRFVQAEAVKPEGGEALLKTVEALEKEYGLKGNRLFYLSLPPSVYGDTVRGLVKSGLMKRHGSEGAWHRIIIEKPFGHSLATARKLNEELREVLGERQIFRIDHYLGKNTVQNLLIFRFGNVIFDPLWNRNFIDHVQITVAEEIGIEGRGAYYEEAGALRDMFQNHLLQVLCMVAMEPPVSFSAESVRDEKVKVLRAIRPWSTSDEIKLNTVRGQYGPGEVKGQVVPSYRQERGAAPNSNRETYAACRFFVDNWRWQDVPFYLRSGKRMPRRSSEIYLHFKSVPHMMFRAADKSEIRSNSLLIRIQPNEGISLQFLAKVPGVGVDMRPVNLNFSYEEDFGQAAPSAYQTLLHQALEGDATLFTRRDEIECQWEIIDPIIKAWDASRPPSFPNYDPGTWGPSRADELLERDNRGWHND
jgi:glucose-6-phosphate 1-dehydrogenase